MQKNDSQQQAPSLDQLELFARDLMKDFGLTPEGAMFGQDRIDPETGRVSTHLYKPYTHGKRSFRSWGSVYCESDNS